MKLPAQADRKAFYYDIILRCLQSRETRIQNYEALRSYYLFGANSDQDGAIHNKIYPSIDTLVSFLFAVDTTRFAIQLGTAADKKIELPKVPPLIQRLNGKWQDSNADILFSGGVEWSLVYNTMIVKLIQRRTETMPFLLAPHNFGVLDEAQPMLDRQEAFVQVFTTTKPQLQRELEAHPERAAILAAVSGAPRQTHELAAGVKRVIVNSQAPLSGSYSGNVNDVSGGSETYRAQSPDELVELYELWVWNDVEDDYQVVTLADPEVCIYDRAASPGMFLKGEHPFTQICPNPAPDYFWGYSEVQKLIRLQELREHHLEQITNLIDRNVTPDKALTGQWGALEEKMFAMQRLGSLIGTQDPTAKVQEFKPQIPQDLWAIIDKIDSMFDETISLNNLSKGQGDTGVRSKGQTESLLRVGSSRPKKRALTIEDSLESIATKYVKLDQKHNPDELNFDTPQKGVDGKPVTVFIAEQFTKDFMVKVDGHSSSPVFVEDQNSEAKWMFENQIIDGESYLDIVQPMNVQILKDKYKVMAANKAKAAEKQEAMAEAEAAGKLKKLNQG